MSVSVSVQDMLSTNQPPAYVCYIITSVSPFCMCTDVPGSPSEVTAVKPSSGDSSAELYVCWTTGPDSYHIQTYQLSVYQRQNGTQLDLFKAVNVAAESVDSVGLQKCALVSRVARVDCGISQWTDMSTNHAVLVCALSHSQ